MFTGVSGAFRVIVTSVSAASGRSVCKTDWITPPTSMIVVGRMRSPDSTRLSDNRSFTKRSIRPASPDMMPKNRSVAAESLRAGPCKVSINPKRAVRGVRNSWLTLATKSRRIWLTCCWWVISSKLTSTAWPAAELTCAQLTIKVVSCAPSLVKYWVWRGVASCRQSSIVSNTAGWRNTVMKCRPLTCEPNSDCALVLAVMIRSSAPISTAGSGIASSKAPKSCASIA